MADMLSSTCQRASTVRWAEAVQGGGEDDGRSLFFLQKVKNQSLTFKGVYEFLA